MRKTIKDIAQNADVSLSTVSRVINNSGYVSKKTRQKIECVIKEYDYVPSMMAKRLSKDSNRIVGVLVPEFDNPFFSGVIKGIYEIADSLNFCVILCDSNEDYEKELRIIHTLKEQRVQGLLISAALGENKQTLEYTKVFKNLDFPVVLIDRDIVECEHDGVYFDDMQAVFAITTLMINEGHRHIEILAGNQELSLGQNRTNGYKMAFSRAGIPYNDNWIHYSLFTQESGYKAMMEILSRDRKLWPTAVIANNNRLSIGALSAIYKNRIRIPQDIAFAGYDQLELLKALQINITLAEKDNIEMGRIAMRMLYERIIEEKGHKQSSPRKIIIKAKLVVRGSEKLPLYI